MPEAAVEEDGISGIGTDRDGAVGVAVFGFDKAVFELAAGHDVKVAPAGFGDVAEPEAYFEGDSGAWTEFQVAVDTTAVLMEAKGFFEGLVLGLFLWGNAQVGMVEVDVPTQDAPDFGKGFGVVQEVDEALVLPHKVGEEQVFVFIQAVLLPFFPDLVHFVLEQR